MSIKYIGKITDTQKFSPMFERALKTKLSALMAYTLTGDKQLVIALEEMYVKHVSEGLAADGQQGSSEMTSSPELHEVRNASTSGYRKIDDA